MLVGRVRTSSEPRRNEQCSTNDIAIRPDKPRTAPMRAKARWASPVCVPILKAPHRPEPWDRRRPMTEPTTRKTMATPCEPGNDQGSSAARETEASGHHRPLSGAARRALAEAEERRRARDAHDASAGRPKELNGRNGPEPVRYGDWEKNGLISDF